MERALYFDTLKDKDVRCSLCPHNCIVSEGQHGICKVRINREGTLFTEVKGKYSAISLDPIEKKPLYHFFPAKSVLSLGTKGCNLKCKFCQNHEIAQSALEDFPYMKVLLDQEILQMASERSNCIGIAYTYNEPTVFFESIISLAPKVKLKGMQNIMVTNGFINPDPLRELLEYIDAFNVDLKAFSETFYKQYTHSRLEPVLGTLKSIRKSGKHLEVSHLLIPGLNSKVTEFEELLRWLAGELGPDTVLHLSRFFPAYKLNSDPTPLELLYRFYDIAKEHLSYVYLGNVNTRFGGITTCRHCGQELIRRFNYEIELVGMDKGRCMSCEKQIFIC